MKIGRDRHFWWILICVLAEPDGKQFPNSMMFGMVEVEPMPDLLHLGGILCKHCCVLQRRKYFARFENSVFTMLWSELLQGNAATDGCSVEYT